MYFHSFNYLVNSTGIQLMMTVDSTRIASFKDGSLLKVN